MSIGPSNFPITPLREAESVRRVEPDSEVRDNDRRERQEQDAKRRAPVDEVEIGAELVSSESIAVVAPQQPVITPEGERHLNIIA